MKHILRIGVCGAALSLLAACGEEPAQHAAVTPPASQTTPAPASDDCDRACLTGLLDQYLAALDAGDPSGLPFADDLRMTEDQVEIRPGEGVWAGDVALTDYRLDIIDEREEIAVTLTRLIENGEQVLMALRLLTDDGRIEGVESMVVRNAEEGMLLNLDGVQILSESMPLTPPADALMRREEMIEIAERYPRGLQVGSFVTSDVPFSADAYRLENGMYMAGPGCDFFPGCDNIREQRLPTLSGITWSVSAVDERQGVVLLRMDFGPGSLLPKPGRPEDATLSVFEAFKVYGGEMHAVEAFMEMKPQDQPLGWD